MVSHQFVDLVLSNKHIVWHTSSRLNKLTLKLVVKSVFPSVWVHSAIFGTHTFTTRSQIVLMWCSWDAECLFEPRFELASFLFSLRSLWQGYFSIARRITQDQVLLTVDVRLALSNALVGFLGKVKIN